MARVNIQPTTTPKWIPFLVVIALIAGVLWWLAEIGDNDDRLLRTEVTSAYNEEAYPAYGEAADGVVVVQPMVVERPVLDVPKQATPNMPFAAIAANPDAYFNKPISGMVTVSRVAQDGYGFWVKQDGVEMFAVRSSSNLFEPLKVGQKVSMTATVYDPNKRIPAVGISPQIRDEVRDDPAYLWVNNMEAQNMEPQNRSVAQYQ
ncbi:MAG: hypothetical protein OHK0029_01020 [Armatimonadaceae bacterium]